MEWLWGYAIALVAVNVLALISGVLAQRYCTVPICLVLSFAEDEEQ